MNFLEDQPPSFASASYLGRRRWLAIAAAAVCASPLPATALRAAPAPDPTVAAAVTDVQHEWEAIRYQAPAAERQKRFEALAAKAHRSSEALPGRSEPLIWEAIVLSSWANEKGGLGALRLAKQAKALFESAQRIDGDALDGSAYGSLGVLYYKVPGWPIGFGDRDKARELLQKALSINPRGIDPNFFYGEFLLETKQPAEAAVYLERALQAPPRPGRDIADEGRRNEAQALLDRVRSSQREASR